jgi:hypothetical protein
LIRYVDLAFKIMTEADPKWLELNLRIGLQALALPADDQFAYHTGACPVCELISDFIYPYQAYLGNFSEKLTPLQIAALGHIAREINTMAPEDVKCFDREVLDHLVWIRMRGLAADALICLGWPMEPPSPYRMSSSGFSVRP